MQYAEEVEGIATQSEAGSLPHLAQMKAAALQWSGGEKCGLGGCAAENIRYSMSILSTGPPQYVVVRMA